MKSGSPLPNGELLDLVRSLGAFRGQEIAGSVTITNFLQKVEMPLDHGDDRETLLSFWIGSSEQIKLIRR
ncbi:MAG: hypothetical protein WCE79_30115 [Xanthobacteraceae bacterium]